ncbi:hypothetical protein M4D79_25440 [Mycolicibacterium novocastrense]|nr:hypothetical protein M4D79_25440 [Mycolicibacterium novocastrense]
MSDPLGLSIGTTNLVAVRIDNRADQPVLRRSVFTVPDGTVMSGFVERVGDDVPLVAADGSSHSADRLLVAALADLVEGSGPPSSDVSIAVPAHWGPPTLRTLRSALRGHPLFGADATITRLVSDAKASLTALQSDLGLPAQGCGGAGRFRRRRNQHHAGGCRRRVRAHRRDDPSHRVLR